MCVISVQLNNIHVWLFFPGRHEYPVPRGDRHCLLLPFIASHVVLDQRSCAYYIQSSVASILPSDSEHDQLLYLQAKSLQTFTVHTQDSLDKVVEQNQSPIKSRVKREILQQICLDRSICHICFGFVLILGGLKTQKRPKLASISNVSRREQPSVM